MRKRRYWYSAAMLVLIAGLLLALVDPLSPRGCGQMSAFSICDNPGKHPIWGPILGAAGLLGSLLLVLVGTLRDPPD
jgi:hypothetical protein